MQVEQTVDNILLSVVMPRCVKVRCHDMPLRCAQVDRMTECGTCEGSGAKAGTKPSTCSACGGAGQVATAVRTPLGVFQQVQDCGECQGTGERTTPCGTCGGDGRVRKTKRIRLPPPSSPGFVKMWKYVTQHEHAVSAASVLPHRIYSAFTCICLQDHRGWTAWCGYFKIIIDAMWR